MAFRIAVSGLKAATADLNVTSNNIANASTTGFKESRTQFSDVYAASSLGTTGDAIGQGVQLASVAQQFNQGNISFTDNSLDLAISGAGFYAVEDASGRFYTRAGAFGMDKNGNVVNPEGQNLLAYQADATGAITAAVAPLQINASNIAPQATSLVNAELNLDAADTIPAVAFDPNVPASYNNSTSMAIYDSLGAEHLATIYTRKTAANTWQAIARVDGNATTAPVGTLTFNTSGVLQAPTAINFGTVATTTGSADIALSVDFNNTTQYGSDYAVHALSHNGFTTGRLSGVDISDDGVVQARFSNGQSKAQGQVMLADFGNPQGLQAMGGTSWAETSSSGPPLNGQPGTATLGLIQSGALEESNTELAEQLVNMIIAQRSFQANAQVIRAEDEVTQTIINIR